MDNQNNSEIIKQNTPKIKNSYGEVCDWIETFVIALSLLVLLFLFLFRYVTVDGDSMTHTLQNQDKLIIVNTYGEYKTGDIVVVRVSGHDQPLIKRVIATEGQEVEIDFENWVVKVDGVALDEPYVRKETNGLMNYSQYYNGPFKVGKGKIFVMGDNRNGSNDSRNPQIGQIDARRTLGKVLIRFSPFDKFGAVD